MRKSFAFPPFQFRNKMKQSLPYYYYMDSGVVGMKKVEQILMKVVIIQFIFLFLSQLIFHQMDVFPQIKQLTKYEGVNENTFTEILQTFQGK